MKLLFAFVAASLAAPTSFAQAEASAAKLPMSEDLVVYASYPTYPAGLAARGVQGLSVVRVTLDADGKASGAALHESSRSQELDDAALALARKLQYGAPAKDGAALGELLVPIRFRKDTLTELSRKTCADFNVDKAYFLTTFPDKQVGNMEVVNMSVGALVFTLQGAQRLEYAKNSKAIVAAAVAGCEARPDEKFFALMQQETAKIVKK